MGVVPQRKGLPCGLCGAAATIVRDSSGVLSKQDWMGSRAVGPRVGACGGLVTGLRGGE